MILPKIVIPSHKRADRVKTTRLVADAIICVAESQADQYREYNPDIEIVTHPDTVVGLPPKLQWIYQKFQNVFFLDDDLLEFRAVYRTQNLKIDDPLMVRDLIYKTAIEAKNAGCYLYGFSKDPNPLMYIAQEPIQLTGFVIGCATGIWHSDKLYWDCSMKMKGDVWISLLNAYYYRKCWKDMRYCFTAEETFKNSGGLTEHRNVEREKEMFDYLKEHFGDVVVEKKEMRLRKKRHPYEMTIKLPF